jgi:hypothetical protein
MSERAPLIDDDAHLFHPEQLDTLRKSNRRVACVTTFLCLCVIGGVVGIVFAVRSKKSDSGDAAPQAPVEQLAQGHYFLPRNANATCQEVSVLTGATNDRGLLFSSQQLLALQHVATLWDSAVNASVVLRMGMLHVDGDGFEDVSFRCPPPGFMGVPAGCANQTARSVAVLARVDADGGLRGLHALRSGAPFLARAEDSLFGAATFEFSPAVNLSAHASVFIAAGAALPSPQCRQSSAVDELDIQHGRFSGLGDVAGNDGGTPLQPAVRYQDALRQLLVDGASNASQWFNHSGFYVDSSPECNFGNISYGDAMQAFDGRFFDFIGEFTLTAKRGAVNFPAALPDGPASVRMYLGASLSPLGVRCTAAYTISGSSDMLTGSDVLEAGKGVASTWFHTLRDTPPNYERVPDFPSSCPAAAKNAWLTPGAS